MTRRLPRVQPSTSSWPPWFVLGFLLILCAFRGLHLVAGLVRPDDTDLLRDVGFIQGFLDGNWFGDPSYAGEWRYYPPFVHAVAALLARLFGVNDVLAFWVQAGVWFNLLTPLMFFFMTKRLLGSSQAAAASAAVFVLFNGAVSRPWMMGGYTPWPLTPSISQALFFTSVWIILERDVPDVTGKKLLNAAMIGALIGLTLLAHLVPAVILTAIVTAVVFGTAGFRPRTIIWLAVVAITELAIAAPYLAPILINYPASVVNIVPGGWVDGLMSPSRSSMMRMFLLNIPGIAALACFWIFRPRMKPLLERASLVALITWIAVCIIAIARHYVCALTEYYPHGVCQIFVLPIHYYQFYLQDAWACLIGYMLWQAFRRIWERSRKCAACRITAVALVGALVAVGGWAFFHRPFDIEVRKKALLDGTGIDLAAYRWILANTAPGDLFVTDFTSDTLYATAFSVMAAGRQMAAVPDVFSNPYVDWKQKNNLRLLYLEAASDPDQPDKVLCDLNRGHGWLLLPNDFRVVQARAEPAFRTRYNTVYRVSGSGCL